MERGGFLDIGLTPRRSRDRCKPRSGGQRRVSNIERATFTDCVLPMGAGNSGCIVCLPSCEDGVYNIFLTAPAGLAARVRFILPETTGF